LVFDFGLHWYLDIATHPGLGNLFALGVVARIPVDLLHGTADGEIIVSPKISGGVLFYH
jgi:hypothetical protein